MDSQVIIVGAGAAGLAAARDLSRAGLNVIVIEARPRIGGRVYTQRIAGWDLPVELGAEFVHGTPEPTRILAQETGVELVPVGSRHGLRTAESWTDRGDVWTRLVRALQRPAPPQDVSVCEYLDQADLPAQDRSLVEMMVEGFEAASLPDISLRSLREEFSDGPPPQFRPARGYGPLIEHLRRDLTSSVRLYLETPVASVHWSEKTGVRVRAIDGRIFAAPHAIVTVPIPALHAEGDRPGGLTFDPPPADWQDALAHLAMGQAVRVVLRFHAPPWVGDLGFDFAHVQQSELPTWWIQSSGRQHQVTCWAGGPAAMALACLEPDRLESLALTRLAAALDVPLSRVRAALAGCHFHDFQNDPFARGAYSYARPCGTGAAQLLQQPLGHALYLAGEATDGEHAGTVAGALASGTRAARQVLARI